MPRVDSVGKYADPVTLVGEVKIEEGSFIQITRNDAHNSLVITDTRPPAPGCSSAFTFQVSTSKPLPIPNPPFTVSVS